MRFGCMGCVAALLSVVLGISAATSSVRGAVAEEPAADGRAIAGRFGLKLSTAPATGVPIRVVDDATGSPVAGALVVAVDETMFGWFFGDGGDPEHDAARRMRDIGIATLADAAGETRVAVPSRPATVMAFHGEHFGRATLEANDPIEHVVRLGSRRLHVEVVDAEGRPVAGLPVALDMRCGIYHEPSFVRDSDARGRVTIEGHELERSVHQGCGRVTVVQFSFPSRPYALRPIDSARLEPVRLVAPPTSRILVELRDTKDRPLEVPAIVQCISQLPWIEDSHSIWPGLGSQRESWCQHVGGPIDLGPFEIGLEATLSIECEAFEFEHSVVAAPLTPGAVRTVVMRARRRVAPEPVDEDPEADSEVPEEGDETTSEPAEPPASRSVIEVTFLVDDPDVVDLLAIRLSPERGENESSTPVAETKFETWLVRRGSRLILREVPPGRYHAALVVGDPLRRDAILVEWDDVVVPERGVLRDPRMREVDLRGRLTCARIEVVDEALQPLHGMIATDSVDGWRDWAIFGDGTVDFSSATPVRRATVFATGREPVTIEPLALSQRVVLKPGPLVRVALPKPLRLPAGCVLGVRLLAIHENGEVGATDSDSGRALLLAGTPTPVRIGGPGRYSATVSLLLSGDGACAWTGELLNTDLDGDGDEDEIVIDAALLASGGVIDVPVTAERLEAALTSLRESMAAASQDESDDDE